MNGSGGNLRSARWAAFTVVACLPVLLGQACPHIGPADITPIPGIGTDNNRTTGNTPPTFSFIEPAEDTDEELGRTVLISWAVSDPDNNATVTLLVDSDRSLNGNEIVILPSVFEDGGPRSLLFDTSSLAPATYRLLARVNDGVNPELIVAAPGRLVLFDSGVTPGNNPPLLLLTTPQASLGVSPEDEVEVDYCAGDPDDDGKTTGSVVPDVIFLFDYDRDPTNDLDLSGPNAAALVSEICSDDTSFPVDLSEFVPGAVNKAILLGCEKENDCGQITLVPELDEQGNPVVDENGDPVLVPELTPGLQFTFEIDPAVIPLQESGEPYHIRGTIWDRANLPVHSYSPGSLSLTQLGAGIIDVGQIGRTISGSKFMGFDAHGRTGSFGCDAGDMDGDGIDDFVIVSQYGSATNGGGAHLVLGLPNKQKFGNEISLNSIGTLYRGTIFTMPVTTGTEGIQCVTRIGDISADDKPDLVFGLPYVETLFDDADDDPWDCDPGCHGDTTPNPYSDSTDSDDPNFFAACPFDDCIGASDHREGTLSIDGDPPQVFICSNDLDLAREAPIDGGYAIIAASNNELTSSVWGIDRMGQRSSTAVGSRFRGAWYERELSQTVNSNAIVPTNRYGQTVSSMPRMTNTDSSISPLYGDNLIVSAPGALQARGLVYIYLNQNLVNFAPEAAGQSYPYYEKSGGECPFVNRTRISPGLMTIAGEAPGDEFGYAKPAGHFNNDGSRDLLIGAPGADRNGLVDGGIVYVILGRPDFELGIGGSTLPGSEFNVVPFGTTLDLSLANPPRLEIHGQNSGDRFGQIQTMVGDISGDGVPEIAIASPWFDAGGVDAGFVAIVFGAQSHTGVFGVEDITTFQLPGVRFYGTQAGGHAGMVINNAGDFNGDSKDDLLICAPDEQRVLNGTNRMGVAYLVLNGPHLTNKSFNLSQVGTAELPGLIFVSPYEMGTADQAPIDFVNTAGDVNNDGFDDILIGVSQADYINPLAPSQRRESAGEMYLVYGNNVGGNASR